MNIESVNFELTTKELEKLTDIETMTLKSLTEKYPDIRDDFQTPLCRFGDLSVVLDHRIPDQYRDDGQVKENRGINFVEIQRDGVTVDFEPVSFSGLKDTVTRKLEYKTANEKRNVSVTFRLVYQNLFE